MSADCFQFAEYFQNYIKMSPNRGCRNDTCTCLQSRALVSHLRWPCQVTRPTHVSEKLPADYGAALNCRAGQPSPPPPPRHFFYNFLFWVTNRCPAVQKFPFQRIELSESITTEWIDCSCRRGNSFVALILVPWGVTEVKACALVQGHTRQITRVRAWFNILQRKAVWQCASL